MVLSSGDTTCFGLIDRMNRRPNNRLRYCRTNGTSLRHNTLLPNDLGLFSSYRIENHVDMCDTTFGYETRGFRLGRSGFAAGWGERFGLVSHTGGKLTS